MNAPQAMSLRRKMLYSLLSVLLAWLVLEIAVLAYAWLGPRAKVSRLQFMYQAHPYRAFAPVPNRTDTDGRRSFNSLGLRGAEISVRPSPDTIRIVCVGASTTFSDGATTDGRSYPARMQRWLQDRYRDAPFRIEVLNAGVQASVTLESIIHFQTRLLDLAPDIAIFHHGVNDSRAMIETPGFQSDLSHARHTFYLPARKWWEASPALSFLFAKRSIGNPYFPQGNVNLEWLILNRPSYLWRPEAGLRGRIQPPMVAAYRRNLRTFVAVARGQGVIPVLSTQVFGPTDPTYAYWKEAMDRLNEAVRDVAAAESVDLIDAAHAIAWDPVAFYDLCHMRDTPEGLGRKAAVFGRALVDRHVIERAAARLRR